MADTLHLGLPYLAAAQAQKHVTMNEALRRLDAIVQLTVDTVGETAPPAVPSEGERHIVGAGAGGAWAGKDGAVAHFVDGAWSFLAPEAGWLAYDRAGREFLVFDDEAWKAVPVPETVATLGVNATPDALNRLAARSNAVLLGTVPAGEGGTGDMRLVIDKEAAGDTGSLVFQVGASGRAEIGLAGGEDFSIKVSRDGVSWFTAMTIDRATGAVSFPAGVAE